MGFLAIRPDDDLLSHGEAPHYHRRCIVSLLSSGWDQVVPMLYCRQENWLALLGLMCCDTALRCRISDDLRSRCSFEHYNLMRILVYLVLSHSERVYPSDVTFSVLFSQLSYLVHQSTLLLHNRLCYMVKPHGQLVSVSSTPHSASTPDLSTS